MYGGMYNAEGKRFRNFRTEGFMPGTDTRLMCPPVNQPYSHYFGSTPCDPKVFEKACELAEIKPTKRQQAKWRDGCGKALQFRRSAVEALEEERKAKEEAARQSA